MSDSSRSSADAEGFDRMNTNFYLREGEETDVVFLAEQPYIFDAHVLERHSQRGTKWYETVPCQKVSKKECLYCMEGHTTRKFAGLPILDGRGKYEKTTKKYMGGAPVPMVFLMAIPLAKVINKKRVDLGGKFGGIVFRLSRANKNYVLDAKMTPVPGQPGQMKVTTMQRAYEGPVPNVAVIFTPDADDVAQNIVNTSSSAASRNQNGAGQRTQAPATSPEAAAPATSYGNGGGLW